MARKTRQRLQTPYADFLPPLSKEEFSALKADIQENKVREAVLIDEDGNVLDGHNRLKIDRDAPTRVIPGLTEAEKEAFVFRSNGVRRNLSPTQKQEVRRKMQATAKRLREEDPRKNTQARVAKLLGVSRQCVDNWFNRDTKNTTNATSGKGGKPKPDARGD